MAAIDWLSMLVAAIELGSIAVWGVVSWRWLSGLEGIPRRPRRDVPWTALHLCGFIILYIVLQGTALACVGVDASGGFDALTPQAKVRFVVGQSLASLAGTGAGALLMLTTAGARCRDLGVPARADQWLGDLRIGALGFLAAVIPVYGLRYILSQIQAYFGQTPTDHALLTMLRDDPWGAGAGMVVFAAAVAAPISEEFAFRLLLQGWLEKIERRWLARRASGPDGTAVGGSAANIPADRGLADAPDRSPGAVAGTGVSKLAAFLPADAGRGPGVSRLYWRSILLSSALFALMHLGAGLDPIPLFVLGVILGYIYHKTHHLLPCIAVHMLFNGMSLLGVWLPMTVKAAEP